MKDIGTANFSSVRPAPGAVDSSRLPSARGNVGDTGFRDKLSALQNSSAVTALSNATAPSPMTAPSNVAAPSNVTIPLKFSNHAIERMHNRGISFSPEQMAKIETAVGRASAKGAKNTLLLTDDSALIVSVKDNTVVTVMDKNALKENVFTNIDSTVMV